MVDNPQFNALIAESEGRVRAMALMHQVLYERKDFAQVELDVYLDRLAGLLAQIHAASQRGIFVHVKAQRMSLDLTRAIPLGLIVNELLSNAFKHAFPDGAKGEVRIELHKASNLQALLSVRDNGPGLPRELDTENSDSLGMQIVYLLTEQIGATLQTVEAEGTVFELRFAPLVNTPEQIAPPQPQAL
jgi:two-component sensor histidine kinase